MRYTDSKVIEWLKIAKRDEVCPFLTCEYCNKAVNNKTKHHIQVKLSASGLKTASQNKTYFVCCSASCASSLSPKYNKPISTVCVQCNKTLIRQVSQIKGRIFCSSSCAAIYNNAHKSTGTRRSKLEVWLEQQLTLLYPDLTIYFNMKDTIKSELDIYIPTLKLAFELNGIFHYEPIYGADKLASIISNDTRKFQACLEQGIELCIIDSSKQKRMTEASSKQYLNIICDIINRKLLS